MTREVNLTRRAHLRRLIPAAKLSAIVLALIILGMALHLPQMASGSQQSQDATLAECLRYMRTQLYIYSLDHNGVSPGFPGNDLTQAADAQTFVEQMTQFTDSNGRTSPQRTPERNKGPYLFAVPSNPVTLKADVMIVTGDGLPRADESKPFGWIYNPITRQISPNLAGADSQGVSYASY